MVLSQGLKPMAQHFFDLSIAQKIEHQWQVAKGYPASSRYFFMRSSFIVTLIFPFVSFPFLSVVVKITYFAESPYSERFACEAFSSFAFPTSLLISYICFLASLGLKVTILFSVILNFLIFSVSVSLNLYSNSSTHSLIRYKFLFCYQFF